MQWRLFGTDIPYVSTFAFHEHRDRAPHLDQPDHQPRLFLAASLVVHAAELLGSATVSDLGCGDGGLLSLLAGEESVTRAWGYDFAPANAAGWAERRVEAYPVDVFGDRNRVRFGDIAVMTEVLEHVADPHGSLRWAGENARYVVASSPRFETPENHAPEHAWAWDTDGYGELFRQAGLRVLRHEVTGLFQVVLAESRTRQRLRPAHSPGLLARLYAAPHDHTRWPDHVERVEATIAFARRTLGHVASGADLSCGSGAILTGLDVPVRHFGDLAPGWEYTGPLEETVERIPDVDVFVCCETLEHLDDPDAVLRQIRARTRRLVVSTPVEAWDDDNPEHYWAWSRRGVEDMLTEAGFTVAAFELLDFRDRGRQFYAFGLWVCQ